MPRRGFTLIELLVVISIISLLSSISLAGLNEARVKARNTAINSQVLEYVKALELYRLDNDNFPNPNSVIPVCLGEYPSGPPGLGVCERWIGNNFQPLNAGTAYRNSQELKNSLSKYIPNYPPVSTQKVWVIDNAFGYLGAWYSHSASIPNPIIQWFINGANQDCIRGAIKQQMLKATWCQLTLY